jgi:hypothetical protein
VLDDGSDSAFAIVGSRMGESTTDGASTGCVEPRGGQFALASDVEAGDAKKGLPTILYRKGFF